MPRTFFITLIALLPLLPAVNCAADAPPIKVFLLAGQSNMQGQGVVQMDDPKDYNGGKGNLVWSMTHSASRLRM